MPYPQNGGNSRLGQNWGNGIVRGIRPLMFVRTTGFRLVDTNATFLPGQFVKLGSDGKVTAITATSDTPIGISVLAKNAPFYLPYEESIEWGAAQYDTANLQFPNVKQVIVINAAGNTVSSGDYSFSSNGGSLTNGVISFVNSDTYGTAGANTPAVGAFVTVRYQYKDASHAPFDQTIATGKVSLIEDNGEVALEVYDTSVAYTVGASVYKDNTGTVTATSAGSAVGFVTRVPTADDVTLGIKVTAF